MRYTPHDYQRQATDYIVTHPQAAIFLGMGLGKTVITLSAIWHLLMDSFQARRVLVIAPLRVARDTWAAEALGSRQQRLDALATGAMVTVINRENIPWLVRTVGSQWPWDMVVIDELSSFKNHNAARFKALASVRKHITRIVGLTGTPAANGLEDLWAQFRLLDGGVRLGRYITHYRARWFEPDKRNATRIFSYKPKPGAAIGDMTLSMQTTDHLTLPPLTVTPQEVTLGPKERDLYEQLVAQMVISLDGQTVDASNAAALSGKLLQLASGAVYAEGHEAVVVHERKLDALEDLIEAANGQSLLVAYWFRHDLERITARFPTARELKTSQDFLAWNRGEIPLGLIHPASAGHGLNLQAGGHVLVWFSLTWSLELYQQTNARLYRQGQTQPVTIIHLTVGNTLDQAVLAALADKDTTQTRLIQAVAAQLTPTNR